MSIQPQLTAIVCADAVGFGAFTAANEDEAHDALAETHARLKRVFEGHGGRVVNTWGDGVIAAFPSIGDAVRAAVAFQDANEGATAALRYRIGVNLADVVHEDGNLFGHGVNVAARLQEAAEPGGILVADVVHAAVAARLALGFDRIAPVAGKPSEPPVSAWRVRLAGASNHPPTTDQNPAAPTATREPASATTAAANRAGARTRSAQHGAAGARLHQIWGELGRLERAGVVFIGFVFSINLLTDPGSWWFLYPALVVGLFIATGRVLRRR